MKIYSFLYHLTAKCQKLLILPCYDKNKIKIYHLKNQMVIWILKNI